MLVRFGVIEEVNEEASFLVLGADPLEDFSAVRDIRLRAGRPSTMSCFLVRTNSSSPECASRGPDPPHKYRFDLEWQRHRLGQAYCLTLSRGKSDRSLDWPSSQVSPPVDKS